MEVSLGIVIAFKFRSVQVYMCSSPLHRRKGILETENGECKETKAKVIVVVD